MTKSAEKRQGCFSLYQLGKGIFSTNLIIINSEDILEKDRKKKEIANFEKCPVSKSG